MTFNIRLIVPLICMTCLMGCSHYEEIASHPPSEWSEPDAFNLIAMSMSNNFVDPRFVEIKVNATAYFPTTIIAIQREAQYKNHWTEEKFREETDLLLVQSMGMYYDWDRNQFADHRARYISSVEQYETMEFMVTIINTQFPRKFYYIKDLKSRVVLNNGHGDEVTPLYVWGRRYDQLTITETLFVKFPLTTSQGRHILTNSSELCLEIQGFEEGPIMLTFPVTQSFFPNVRN